MENYRFIKQYTLSDLFDSTFKMLKYTWKNTLIICAVCFIPLAILGVTFTTEYFKVLSEVFASGIPVAVGSRDMSGLMETLSPFFRLLGFGILFSIVSGIVYTFVKGVIVLNSFKVAQGESPELKELVLIVLREKLGTLIIQGILYFLILMGIMLAGGIVMGILSGIFAIVSSGLSALIIVFCIIGLICFSIWLLISFIFIQEAVLYSGTSPVESFKKSLSLVQGNWWRVLGIFFVFGIALSFFISIVTTPLIFSFLLPLYSQLFENFLNGGAMEGFYSSMFTMYSKAVVPLYFSSLLNLFFTFFISPVFSSLFFLDLMYRKKEIHPEPDDIDDAGDMEFAGNEGDISVDGSSTDAGDETSDDSHSSGESPRTTGDNLQAGIEEDDEQ